jgi:hypothetical protein
MILVLFALLLIIALIVGVVMWMRTPKQQLKGTFNKLIKLTKSTPRRSQV